MKKACLAAAALCLITACGGPAARHPLLNPSLRNLRRIPLPPAKVKVMELVEQRLARGDADHISVMFQCLSTGYWFGIGEHENFIPASLLKSHLLITVLKAAQDEPGLLQRKVEYKDYSNVFTPGARPEQRVRPGRQFTFGHHYTIEQLLKQMIEQSDNNAAYNLQVSLAPGQFEQVLQDYGIRLPPDGAAFITLKNYMMMLLSLYNASYLSIEMSQRALDWLTLAAYDKGLAAGLPPGVHLANKFGERELISSSGSSTQLHDCGIIYHEQAPYLLGVMTRGSDLEKQTAIIRDISALVYAEVDAGVKAGR
ncbi:MAG TPA: class A beta-lactamase-related serine hydrolase [Elusimicrobiales bacterium]|nr:class A beta-lactamase-related serine hydrolase [Elusimicrobiales bacterium]